MSWKTGLSRNLTFKRHKKLRLFHIVPKENFQKFSLMVIESQNLPILQSLDIDSQISHFKWTLHNGRRKIHKENRSDTKKKEIIEYRRNRNQ